MKTNLLKSLTTGMTSFLIIAIMLTSCLIITGCGSSEELTDDDIDYALNEGGGEDSLPNDPKKAARANEMNKDVNNFLGTWTATSEEAQNLYGNFKLTINEDGTFDADITNEKFSGTWTKIDKGISFTSLYMKGTIYYAKTGHIIIHDTENGDTKIVMNKVE